MRKEGKKASSAMMDPWSIFLYGMKAPMTREKSGWLMIMKVLVMYFANKLTMNKH